MAFLKSNSGAKRCGDWQHEADQGSRLADQRFLAGTIPAGSRDLSLLPPDFRYRKRLP